jgi:hypothetical protein
MPGSHLMKTVRVRSHGESFRLHTKLMSTLEARQEKRRVRLSELSSLTAWEDIKRVDSCLNKPSLSTMLM